MASMRSIAAGCALLCALATTAAAADLTRQIDIQGGRVKVTLSDLPPDQAPAGPGRSPRVGVAPAMLLAASLARKLDDTGKAVVSSPAQFNTGPAGTPAALQDQATGVAAFDVLTRSEFNDSLAAACRRLKLDYALYASTPQIGAGASVSTYLLGVGRMKQSQALELRLYDCKTKAAVWKQKVKVENSQGLWTNVIAGNGTYGGGASDEAAATIIAEKLVQDMRW